MRVTQITGSSFLAICLLAHGPALGQLLPDAGKANDTELTAGQCAGVSGCRSNGHHSLDAGPYPYTEDIAGPGKVPCSTPLTVPGVNCGQQITADGFSTVNYRCTSSSVGGNVNGSDPFNVLLRAYFSIEPATTAPVGAQYEVKLLVDNVEHGWYIRRLRGNYPYGESFEGSAQGLTAGDHTFSVVVKLASGTPGSMSLKGSWMTAQGAPAAFPSGKVATTTSPITITSTWSAVSNTLAFTTTEATDIALQGYFSLTAGTANETSSLGF